MEKKMYSYIALVAVGLLTLDLSAGKNEKRMRKEIKNSEKQKIGINRSYAIQKKKKQLSRPVDSFQCQHRQRLTYCEIAAMGITWVSCCGPIVYSAINDPQFDTFGKFAGLAFVSGWLATIPTLLIGLGATWFTDRYSCKKNN